MKKKMFAVMVGIGALYYNAQSMLLQPLPSAFSQELQDKIEGTCISMRWQGPFFALEVSYDHGETRFNLEIDATCPVSSELVKKMDWATDCNGNACLTYAYNPVTPASSDSLVDRPSKEKPADNLVQKHERLVCDANACQSTIQTVQTMLTGKKVLFYTGAGISALSVPTMEKLVNSLQFSNEYDEQWLTTILNNPKEYIALMEDFFNACVHANPTPAHRAIKDMCVANQWGVATENVDLLHERTGIDPVKRSAIRELLGNDSVDDFKRIDYIVTVGLASDQSGLLYQYKKHNPAGVIIAINLEHPSYLSSEDFIVLGDAQELVPQLAMGS